MFQSMGHDTLYSMIKVWHKLLSTIIMRRKKHFGSHVVSHKPLEQRFLYGWYTKLISSESQLVTNAICESFLKSVDSSSMCETACYVPTDSNNVLKTYI